MYGKSSKSKKQDDTINTLNCSSMNTWNTGNSLNKPANGLENGFNSYGNVDPRMSVPVMPNLADAEQKQSMQYYHYMQYMQVMQMKAAAAYSTNPLGIGLNPLENLPSVIAQSSYSLAAQLPGMPPGRPRPQAGDPRAYSVGRSDDGSRRDNGTGGSGGQRSSLTKSSLTYGEYKRQQEMLNNPNMKRNSPDGDGWNDPPMSSRQKQSNAPPVDDWDDEPTPSASRKPARKSHAPPVDDWDDEPTPSASRKPARKSHAPPVDDWDDEPTPSAVKKPMRKSHAPPVDDWDDEPASEKMRKPHGDPWDEPTSKPARTNSAQKDEWNDEPVAKKKPATDDWDDEPAPHSSRSFSHTRSIEPVDDWEDAPPAPTRGGGRDSFDRGAYRGRGGRRGGGSGGGSRAFEKREGDWDCTDCGNNNFKWRKECQKCGTAGGNSEANSRSSRGGFNRGRDRYNRGSSRDSSQSSDHHVAAKDDWDDEGSVKSNGSNGGRRGGYNSYKRRHDDPSRGPPKRHDARDTQSLGDDWDDEPMKAKASKMPPVPVDDWDDEPVPAPKKHAPSKNDDWDDDKGPRSPSPERERRRRRRPSPANDKYRRLEIELKLQRLENERLKLAFSGRRIGMTPSPPRSPSPEYEPVSRRRRYSPKEDKSKWESRRYRDSSVDRSISSHRRRVLEDDTKSNGSSSKSSSHKSRYSERVETEVKSVKPSDTHMMIRGSVTSAALPPHELKKLPNYAHLYSLPSQDVQPIEDDIPPAPIISDSTARKKKDKKSRWSNQPALKVNVVVLDEENWDDADIGETESPKKSKEISTESKTNDEDNWDDENAPEGIQKADGAEENKKSSSETSEQKDCWDEDDKLAAVNDKSQDSSNQGPKKIDADFLGQQIAVQIEKIRHRQAILAQQHLNTQVLLGTPPPAPQSPPIIIEKLGATIIDDIYDVSMPPPVIISADAIISSDVSPIESVILAQAIQITNKARGFESIALAPVIHQKIAVAAPPIEVIDLVDAPEVIVNSREGIEVLRPTYGLLRKNVQVKQMIQKSKLVENWDDDDEESNQPKKVDLNTLSSALKNDDLLQVVSDEENWEDDQDENIKNTNDCKIRNREEESKSKKYEDRSRKGDERSHKSRKRRESCDKDNWDDEESNQVYQQVDPDILARHMAEFAAGTSQKRKSTTSDENGRSSENKKSANTINPVDDENWDDDPELEAASKKLIDPEIIAKNVPLHNSMDSEAILAKTNKIVPLENTSESFRKEFGDSTKSREKSKVMKALSTMPSSVASMPVSAAIAAYAAQKRKLNEQSYDYQPRREWKHSEPYSYPPTDYTVPVDYGRVPQSHPTHYGTTYDYNKYYKSNYSAPTKEKLSPIIVEPKVKQLKSKSPVKKTKTTVQVQKKKKLELNAEDLSDGEIVDSEEDFGSMSDINSANEDDDVIEIPVKVDLVDLTEEEMAAAVKIESVTADIKKERGFIPPMPTEEIEIPKPPEIEDSPESPVNMEVNEDPAEWHENANTQEDSPASPENMNVTEEHQNKEETFKKYSESPASPINTETATEILETPKDVIHSVKTLIDNEIENSPASPSETANVSEPLEKIIPSEESSIDNENKDSPASPVETATEVLESLENVISSEKTSIDNVIEDSPASPVDIETATKILGTDDVQESQLDNGSKASESVIASEDNEIGESPDSPVNDENAQESTEVPQTDIQETQLDNGSKASENVIASEDSEIGELPSSPVYNKDVTSGKCTVYTESNSSSVYIANEHNIVIKKLREETGFLKEIITVTSPDSPEKEYSKESPRTLEENTEENTEEEKAKKSPSNPVTNDSSRIEAQPEKYLSEVNHSLSLDPVEVNDKKLPEQVEITSKLIDTSMNSKELVTIASTETPVDEISLENHEKEETPKIDTQETEDCNQETSKVVDAASESDSEMDDDDILLDDDELEAAALFLKNETVNNTEATATATTNENREASVEVSDPKSTVVLNGSSIEDDAHFNPYILIKKEKLTELPRMVAKEPAPTDPDSDIEEVPVTETPASNRRSSRIRQLPRK